MGETPRGPYQVNLEQEIRAIRDEDQLVQFAARQSDLYRIMSNQGAGPKETREALLHLGNLTTRLEDWLIASQEPETGEQQAWRKLNAALGERLESGHDLRDELCESLSQLRVVLSRAREFVPTSKPPKAAQRHLARALWDSLPSMGIPVMKSAEGDAVRIMIAIARAGGDRHMNADVARVTLGKEEPR